jgi:hypothetical protein
MAGRKHNLWCNACRIGFLPAGNTKAPFVAGVESREVVGGHWGTEVITARSAEGEKFGGNFGTNGVAAVIHWPGLAETIAVEARAGTGAAALEFGAEDIFGAAAEILGVSHRDF